VTLLDDEQERLLQALLLCEQLFDNFEEQFVGGVFFEVAGDIQDDRDVLFQCEGRQLLGMFRRDDDVALVVGTGVEDLVLLF